MSSVKIGVGLCTYNRPDKALQTAKAVKETTQGVNLVCSIDGGDFSKYNIEEFLKLGYEVIVGDNQGVVRNKNRIINYLQNCDYLFIIEDDLTPMKAGWVELYIEALRCTGYDHINFIPETARATKIKEKKYSDSITLTYYGLLSGQLMVMTNKCLHQVGILDPEYKFYGHGHTDYTRRCQQAKLHASSEEGYPHVMGIDEYLRLDYTIPSITESTAKYNYIKLNGDRFRKGSPRICIPVNEFLR